MGFGKLFSPVANTISNVPVVGKPIASVVNAWTGGPQDKGIFGTGILGGKDKWEPSDPPYQPPKWSTITDPSGRLPSQYTLTNPQIGQPNYLEALNTERLQLQNQTHPWVQQMRDQIQADYLTNREKADLNIRGQLQNAMETLASRGGARSGSREYLAGQGQGALFKEIQQLGRQASQQRRDVGTKAYETSLGILEKLPGFQAERERMQASVNQFNINNMLRERENAFKAQMDAYQTQMSQWAAQQQASATAHAARPGFVSGLLGSNGLL